MKLVDDCDYNREDIQRILDSPIPYANKEERIQSEVSGCFVAGGRCGSGIIPHAITFEVVPILCRSVWYRLCVSLW
jgi:hypothetical protein